MKSSRPFQLLFITLLAAVLLYFIVQSVHYFSSPFSTSVAYQSMTEETIDATGYLVRNEEVLSDGGGTLRHVAAEGAKIGVGQTIAESYRNAGALDTVSQIEKLELQQQQLQFALDSYLDNDAALKLDSSITSAVLALHQSLVGGDYTLAQEDLSALKASILKRGYSITSPEEIRDDLHQVKAQIEELRGTLSGADYITAQRSGTYSYACDGYETVLTPAFLESVTPASLKNLTPADSGSHIGKMIYGETWYFAAAISESEAGRLHTGQAVTLRLSKGLTQDAEATVERISAAENGQVAVVLSCREYLANVTQLRQLSAELIVDSHHGLRVPSNALRVEEDGRTGVYCVIGQEARFKPCSVVYHGDDYTLVKADPLAEGAAILRHGDEVIITANALSDGALVR